MRKHRHITYYFKLENEEEVSYEIKLNEDSLSLVKPESEPVEWTDLDYKKCSNCPLTKATHENCPIAYNLHHMVEFFKDMISHHECTVMVETSERSYIKKTSLQDGLFSIFGIIMASSGCPHMNFLKPMVRFHLPFATVEEGIYRSMSTYLLGQYYKGTKGEKVEFNFDQLEKYYAEVEEVNQGILNRINSIAKGDADKNALVALNILAQMVPCELNSNLGLLKNIFDHD